MIGVCLMKTCQIFVAKPIIKILSLDGVPGKRLGISCVT